MPNLISIAAAAEQLGLSRSTLYGLAKNRRIPCVRIGDRILLDLEKVIAACEIEPDGESPLPPGCKGRMQVAESK
jgi:excisionase family DNA binding protein